MTKTKKLIQALLETYICPEAVETHEHKYSQSGLYYAPKATNIHQFLMYIRGLPSEPLPEAFGLHDNCNISCAQNEALRLLSGMVSMLFAGKRSDGGLEEDKSTDRTAASIKARLPEPFIMETVEDAFPTMYEESMNTLLKQECLRYNRLLTEMSTTLEAFRKAIKGAIVMTAELEQLGKSMLVNEVPDLWTKRGPLSLKPLSSWFLDILARCAFFQGWIDLGCTPPCFWVSGIFFPQAFFTGALQNHARMHQEEIDLLSFQQSTLNDVSNPRRELHVAPEAGVFVYGFFLEGARWDRDDELLQDSRPTELFTELPALWLLPMKDRQPNIKDYCCPCYKVVSRKGVLLTTGHSTNFVLYIELPTRESVSKWTKAGVAAFLALKH